MTGGCRPTSAGTGTAGSVRVPASYGGMWGLRPTWGAVSLDGVVPLSPSYDVAGVLAASGRLLAAGSRVSGDKAKFRDPAR